MTRRPIVYYVGMITTDAYGRSIGARIYAGAAARKMTVVAQAMRSIGLRSIIVSLPFVGTDAKQTAFGPVVTSDGGVPTFFTATLRSPVLRKLAGQFYLADFFLRHVRRDDTVIFYNHSVEYLLTLLLLRLKGVRLVQDIEDAPTGDEVGLRGLLNRVSFAITYRLTEPRKMVVADHVAKCLGLDDYVTIRGVASQEVGAGPPPNLRKWAELRTGEALKLHFGGSLLVETGVDLFCESVELLMRSADRLSCRVSFKVTGVGDLDKIRGLQERVANSAKVGVELLPELSKAEYFSLIGACHGSLSLKRPGSAMSNTTFPSKVIEITAAGLALVSTRLGDVTEIFDQDSAYFIAGYQPENLVETIIEMAAAPERVERIAAAGSELCNKVFAPEVVGEEMKRLL